MAKPLNRIPMNRFAYHSHDDGWFNKLFVEDLRDYKSLLSNVIISKLEVITRRTFTELPDEITSVLLESTREGLFIDLSRIVKTRVKVKVPLTGIGHHTDMDRVYNFREEIKDYKIFIEYSETKKSWQLLKEG
ncbi:hypothetical protein [Paenibacillus dendrobii]|nr:hypothetical protein [Paenibacillus dendrobii]